MKTDVAGLMKVITRQGMTVEAIAKKIGINRSTFYRKLSSDGEKFTIGEVHRMVDALPITTEEAVHIFLADNSQ